MNTRVIDWLISSNKGEPILEWAVNNNKPILIKNLLKHPHIKINYKVLKLAVLRDNIEIMTILLANTILVESEYEWLIKIANKTGNDEMSNFIQKIRDKKIIKNI